MLSFVLSWPFSYSISKHFMFSSEWWRNTWPWTLTSPLLLSSYELGSFLKNGCRILLVRCNRNMWYICICFAMQLLFLSLLLFILLWLHACLLMCMYICFFVRARLCACFRCCLCMWLPLRNAFCIFLVKNRLMKCVLDFKTFF